MVRQTLPYEVHLMEYERYFQPYYQIYSQRLRLKIKPHFKCTRYFAHTSLGDSILNLLLSTIEVALTLNFGAFVTQTLHLT